jgi:cell division protein FtsB
VRKLAFWSVIVFAAYAAVQCGEYSTLDLLRQRSREAMLLGAIDSLARDVDSLKRLRQLIRNDPATQERIAREAFGMVKGDRELLYRFVDPDSLKARNP